MDYSNLFVSNSTPFLLLILLISAVEAVKFNCTGTATCQGLAGYVPANSTTYGAVLSLFQVPTLTNLLGANNLPLSTAASHPVPAGSVVRVPFPCACADGVGRSNRTPVYIVKPTDAGLDDIARLTYDLFITYQEIAEANEIVNVDKIHTGEKLWIPLPCSCDAVDGAEVVHLAHLVEAGSTIDGIAEQFETSSETLLRLNGIGDPRQLQAGQAIDVPLKACSSSISSTSLDSNLRLQNGSYTLTANSCIQCSCSSASGYQLTCNTTQGLSKSCPTAKCQNQLFVGNTSNSGCEHTTCAYAGYTKAKDSSNITILTKAITQPLCNNGSVPTSAPAASNGSGSQPGGSSHACRRALQGNWMWLVTSAVIALIGFRF